MPVNGQPEKVSHRVPLPPAFVAKPFSRRKALSAGLSDSRLRSRDLVRSFHGVRIHRDLPNDTLWRCRSYQERMGAGFTFSHWTAAALLGVPLPDYVDRSTVHVSARHPARKPGGVGVTGHQVAADVWQSTELILRDDDTGDLDVFPIVPPALLWAQLATTLDLDDLVAVGDAIVTSRGPSVLAVGSMAVLDDLAAIAAVHAGRRGVRALQRALRLVRVGSLSRPESLLRLMLVRAGIPEPHLNLTVCDRAGAAIAMADLCWPDYRVLVEYEGDGHRTSRTKFRSDITRIEKYADGDWFGMRASADDVFVDPNPFIGRVARRLVARGWRPRRTELRHIAAARS